MRSSCHAYLEISILQHATRDCRGGGGSYFLPPTVQLRQPNMSYRGRIARSRAARNDQSMCLFQYRPMLVQYKVWRTCQEELFGSEVKLESRYDRPLKERLPRSSLDCEVRTAGHSRLRLSGSPSPTLGQVCNQVGNFGFSVSSSQISGWHLDLISHSYARQKVTSFETPAAAAFANITICSAFVIDQDSRTSAV